MCYLFEEEKKYSRVVQLTRLESKYGPTSPPPFIIPVTLSRTFPYIFQAHTLSSTYSFRCHKPLTYPVDHPKRK